MHTHARISHRYTSNKSDFFTHSLLHTYTDTHSLTHSTILLDIMYPLHTTIFRSIFNWLIFRIGYFFPWIRCILSLCGCSEWILPFYFIGENLLNFVSLCKWTSLVAILHFILFSKMTNNMIMFYLSITEKKYSFFYFTFEVNFYCHLHSILSIPPLTH